MRTLLVAFALVGCAGLCFAGGLGATGGENALDAAFLQSWLQVDAASAAKLASDGAAAATARRELLRSAAAAGTFGAAALPGAYPSPPPPPEPSPPPPKPSPPPPPKPTPPPPKPIICGPLCQTCTSPTVCTKCVATSNGKSVFLNTQKVCRVCNALNCKTCSADGKCAVCNAGFRRLASGTCERICSDARCLSCPANADVCTSCVAQSGGFSIFLNLSGQCKACLKANCSICNRSGNCLTCKTGFEPDGRGGCRVPCTLPNCAVCPARRGVTPTCQECDPGYMFLSATDKQCVPVCSILNCAHCIAGSAGKKCFACKVGFVLSAAKTRCTARRRTGG
ncbi:hypothetical protein ABPG75_010758 [Micractinium tetrahymenae]